MDTHNESWDPEFLQALQQEKNLWSRALSRKLARLCFAERYLHGNRRIIRTLAKQPSDVAVILVYHEAEKQGMVQDYLRVMEEGSKTSVAVRDLIPDGTPLGKYLRQLLMSNLSNYFRHLDYVMDTLYGEDASIEPLSVSVPVIREEAQFSPLVELFLRNLLGRAGWLSISLRGFDPNEACPATTDFEIKYIEERIPIRFADKEMEYSIQRPSHLAGVIERFSLTLCIEGAEEEARQLSAVQVVAIGNDLFLDFHYLTWPEEPTSRTMEFRLKTGETAKLQLEIRPADELRLEHLEES